MISWFSDLWCRTFHKKALWPIHGKYVCSTCLREHVVDWEAPAGELRMASSDRVDVAEVQEQRA